MSLPRFHTDERAQCRLQVLQSSGHEAIVHPTAIASISDQPCPFELAKVERQARLRRDELRLQFADTALALAKLTHNRQSGLFGQRLKLLDDLLSLRWG